MLLSSLCCGLFPNHSTGARVYLRVGSSAGAPLITFLLASITCPPAKTMQLKDAFEALGRVQVKAVEVCGGRAVHVTRPFFSPLQLQHQVL